MVKLYVWLSLDQANKSIPIGIHELNNICMAGLSPLIADENNHCMNQSKWAGRVK